MIGCQASSIRKALGFGSDSAGLNTASSSGGVLRLYVLCFYQGVKTWEMFLTWASH